LILTFRFCISHSRHHRPRDDIPRRHPRLPNIGRERIAETLFERPQEGVAPHVEMFWPHAVAKVTGTELDQVRGHFLETVEAVHCQLYRGHQPLGLWSNIVREQRTGFGSQNKDAAVKELASDIGDGHHQLKRRLDEFNLL
jgi:hypothetical protein